MTLEELEQKKQKTLLKLNSVFGNPKKEIELNAELQEIEDAIAELTTDNGKKKTFLAETVDDGNHIELKPLVADGKKSNIEIRKPIDINEQFNLGLKYAEGRDVPKDENQAFQHFQIAAERGHAMAQFNLGVMYQQGLGVAQDYTVAREWFQKAAEQDNVTAQRLLGICFYKGRGVKKNYQRAAEWLRKSLNHDSFALDDDKDYKKAEKFFADKNYQKAAQLYQHIWQEWEDMTM